MVRTIDCTALENECYHCRIKACFRSIRSGSDFRARLMFEGLDRASQNKSKSGLFKPRQASTEFRACIVISCKPIPQHQYHWIGKISLWYFSICVPALSE